MKFFAMKDLEEVKEAMGKLDNFRTQLTEVITKLGSLKIEDIELEDCSETSESSDSSCERRRRHKRGPHGYGHHGFGRHGKFGGRHGKFGGRRRRHGRHNKDSSTDTDSSCEKRGHGMRRKRMMWMKKFKGKFSPEEWKEKK